MRHIAFIMFFKTGFQIFGTADVKVCSGCFIHEYVNVIEVGHRVFYGKLALSGMLAVSPAPSALQITPRQSSPAGSPRLRPWLAGAKSRRNRDEDWWAMRASPEFFNYAENLL